MAVKANLTTKASQPDQVDSYMKKLQHPRKAEPILRTDGEIGEESNRRRSSTRGQ
jgi:hypothetical protein